jgi:hypothetical protein
MVNLETVGQSYGRGVAKVGVGGKAVNASMRKRLKR